MAVELAMRKGLDVPDAEWPSDPAHFEVVGVAVVVQAGFDLYPVVNNMLKYAVWITCQRRTS